LLMKYWILKLFRISASPHIYAKYIVRYGQMVFVKKMVQCLSWMWPNWVNLTVSRICAQ
jgi:hypothetical protein